MKEFEKLGIEKDILKNIEKMKIKEPTDIQAKTIPSVLEGKDVIAGSATGSGKTIAFGVGLIQNAEKRGYIQSLVVTPTRELAEQVTESLKKLSSSLRIISVYGGVAINPQIHHLKKADIVVGTPGRLLDHLNRKTIDLRNVKTVVLDEADLMLDMGFIDDVEKIIKQCPKDKQMLFFSATIKGDLGRIVKIYMKNPVKVMSEEYVDPKKLSQVYYDVKDNEKLSVLVSLLKKEKSDLVMVFCNTRKYVDFVADTLKLNGIRAEAIHGGFTQSKRNYMMSKFHSKSVTVLVCTDVAARGLDIKGVSHVYNFDVPKESKQYVHRIGRTARAGKEGKAITLLSQRDHEFFKRVLRDNDLDIEKAETPKTERIKIAKKDNNRGSFRKSPRRSGPSRPRRTNRRSRK